jgi:hypothetical protein
MNIIDTLRTRFEANMHRHPNVEWSAVEAALSQQQELRTAVQWMEDSGGMPDVVDFGHKTPTLAFVDCSPESPAGRRSLCYDDDALNERKEYKPAASALGLAAAAGITLLTEHEYIRLQQFGPFDCKTSSWLATPHDVRQLGGALFGDHRFGRTFVYHNGAQSYYAARGFRARIYIE